MTYAQNILHMSQCTHGHVSSRNVAPFHRSRGGFEWFDGHQKCVVEVFFILTLRYLSVPKIANLEF